MKQEVKQQMPDWVDAPEWAMYRAIDEDGEWYWFEKKPKVVSFNYNGIWVLGGKSELIGYFDPTNWRNSLQQRPQIETETI